MNIVRGVHARVASRVSARYGGSDTFHLDLETILCQSSTPFNPQVSPMKLVFEEQYHSVTRFQITSCDNNEKKKLSKSSAAL